MNTLCKTEVVSMWLQMWPESLYRIRHRVWRPLVLQFAMAKFGHYVYIEPGRFVFKQGIKDYIAASRKHGVLFGGKQVKHSSYVVTNPHMYTFLMTNERKLQATPHFEFNLAVIHNTRRVKHEFMRYLVSCALEEYCIAPPGSKVSCDLNMGNNKKYARCHRYDESAINLILNRWHNYQPREYLLRDGITRPFDGKDMAAMVKVCNGSRKDEM
ncbi:metk_1 protein [Plakobranchus ocellatus]|uniref:Metk_1 protein n=1 Tax=Plakobranchus ocellatus TaxID=259542 RepID=A0AAV4BVE4_9GAST|nr:metk_1 protein [Plakobranchus ocellatus]